MTTTDTHTELTTAFEHLVDRIDAGRPTIADTTARIDDLRRQIAVARGTLAALASR